MAERLRPIESALGLERAREVRRLLKKLTLALNSYSHSDVKFKISDLKSEIGNLRFEIQNPEN